MLIKSRTCYVQNHYLFRFVAWWNVTKLFTLTHTPWVIAFNIWLPVRYIYRSYTSTLMKKKKNCNKLLDKSMKQNSCNDLFIINRIEISFLCISHIYAKAYVLVAIFLFRDKRVKWIRIFTKSILSIYLIRDYRNKLLTLIQFFLHFPQKIFWPLIDQSEHREFWQTRLSRTEYEVT